MEKKKNMAEQKLKRKGLPLFKFLFGNRNEISLLEEEQIVSPFKTVVRTFVANRVAMVALVIFVIIALMVSIFPILDPVDLSYSEATQTNIPAGAKFLNIPAEMRDNPQLITVGSGFSAGIDKEGKVHVWGLTKPANTPDLAELPEKVRDKKFELLAAGSNHLIGLTEDHQVVAWGNRRLGQLNVPADLKRNAEVKQIAASNQFSIIVTKKGETVFIGNGMNTDYLDGHEYQGRIEKVALSLNSVIGLTTDGQVVYLGKDFGGSAAKVPEGKGYKDIIAAGKSFYAIDAQGKLHFWGNATVRGENKAPEMKSPVVSMQAGLYHFVAILEDGTAVSWGDDTLHQTELKLPGNKKYKQVYANYFQNYVVDQDGQVHASGKARYLMGTDELGRDVFNRLMNGGRMTLTIGTVAVIISTIIGTILGGISGFFGGKVDMLLQRIGEIVNSLPFLPTIIILNSIIGNRMTSNQRIYLVMVLLGLLSWVQLMRLIRAQVLSVREQEFVTAARAMGIREMSIVFRHIIPNVISIIIVSATLSFAGSLLTEASLSFLGFGVQPPQPTWGNMILGANDSTVMANYWWRWVFPAAVLSICVICINLIGTGLDDAVNPKSQDR